MSQFKPHLIATLFNDTTNSYKFYWFLAILNRLKESPAKVIPMADLATGMLDLVWYPLSYFKLSFGKQDQFAAIARKVDEFVDPTSKTSILDQVKKDGHSEISLSIKRDIEGLIRYVPYRFIRPFFSNELKAIKDQEVDKKIVQLANEWSMKDSCKLPYSFGKDCIILNEPWLNYFRENMGLLQNFCYWELANFVQKHNPNVPGISLKLFRPEKRDLKLNTACWDYYLDQHPGTLCIYSHQPVPARHTLDHFLPWSFVTHNLNWNIVPVSREVNSSKSNNLPSLKAYLPGLSKLQWEFVQTLYKQDNKFNRLLEHYVLLFNTSISEIAGMQEDKFGRKLQDTIRPQYQIASNMPFTPDWKFKAK